MQFVSRLAKLTRTLLVLFKQLSHKAIHWAFVCVWVGLFLFCFVVVFFFCFVLFFFFFFFFFFLLMITCLFITLRSGVCSESLL